MNHPNLEFDESGILGAPSKQYAKEWEAVLAALSIPYRKIESCRLYVPTEHHARVIREISEYESERDWFNKYLQKWHNPLPPAKPFRVSGGALLMPVAILAGFILTGPANDAMVCFSRGLNSSAAISAGEWWRPITALCLHADISHALGNAVFLALFSIPLFALFGYGFAGIMILAGGIFGNLTALAINHGESYRALGASTAVFAALGMLAGFGIRRRQYMNLIRGIWIPFVAALAILGICGAGYGSDLAAHAGGFIWGIILGYAAFPLHRRKHRKIWQAIAGIITIAIITGAWLAAMA